MELKQFIKKVITETVEATEELTQELARDISIGQLGTSEHTKMKFDLSVSTFQKEDSGKGIESIKVCGFSIDGKLRSIREINNASESRLSFEVYINNINHQTQLNRRKENEDAHKYHYPS